MESLEQFMKKHKENKEKSNDFVSYLYELMDKYGYQDNSDFYKKADISRQQWSSIISGKHQPTLNTALKLLFALRLNNHECKYLLKKAGYTLSSSSDFALIIRYCIENQIYDLDEVNDLLSKNGFEKQLIY